MLKYRIKIILDFCKEKGAVFNRSFFIFTGELKHQRTGEKSSCRSVAKKSCENAKRGGIPILKVAGRC